jgi:hypothetical protein
MPPQSHDASTTHAAVVLRVLAEAVDPDRAFPGRRGDRHAIAGTMALTRSRHTLLDDATAKIDINPPSRRPRNRRPEAGVGDLLPASDTCQSLGFVDLHG